MKKSLFKSNQLHSAECQQKARFRPAAFALALMSASAAFVPSQAVHAQSASLEEIIVTARKREESLQETPVAVNVLTADALSSGKIEGIKDLGTIVPGLVTTEAAASTAGNIYLRGVGTGALSPLFDQAVSINVDGVGISSAALMNAGMFDLERVEVLRGPQALFFGKNSPGGVIALHTADPGDEFELKVSATYELEGEEPGVQLVVSSPFSDTLRGRLSLGWSDADNHRFEGHGLNAFEATPFGTVQTAFDVDEDPVQTEKVYAMGTLVYEPTDTFSAKLKYAFLEENQDGHTLWNFQRTQCPYGAPQAIYPVPGVDNCSADGDVISAGFNPLLVAADSNFPGANDFFADNEDNLVSLEINYALTDSLDLTAVTGYYKNDAERLGDSSFAAATGLINSVISETEQFSQEIRINSSFDSDINFAAGVYFEDKTVAQQNSVTASSQFFGFPPAFFGYFPIFFGEQWVEQDTTAYSVFGQVIWDISDKLTLAAGARYSYEEKEAVFSAATDITTFSGLPPLSRIDVPLLDDNPDWTNVSPELTLSYQATDDIMYFASYKSGFKSGGFDAAWKPTTIGPNALFGGPAYDNVYDEEEADGFEIGMKSDLLDGTLRLNATAYYYEYDGLQLSRLSSDGGVPSLQVQNAASATVQGAELEATWLAPIDGLRLTANIALNDATYDDYIAACYTGQTVALGCDVVIPGVPGFSGADMSGEALQNAPELNATFGLDYVMDLNSGWEVAFNVTSAYTDEYNPTSSLYPDSYWQESYWLHNASVTLSSSDDNLSFFVRGINLGDEYYSATGSDLPGTGNSALTGTTDGSGLADFFQFVNGGRQILVGVTYRM